MIIEAIVEGRVVDTITIGREITYTTRAAQSTVESKIDLLGKEAAIELLRSWSNGYLTTSEKVDD